MRRISFMKTTPALLAGEKTVTRRMGWANLRPGTRLEAVDDYRKKSPRVLGVLEVVSVRRERVDAITDEDVAREGFAMSAAEFVAMYCEVFRCEPGTLVTRIEFRLVERRQGDLFAGGAG